MIFRTYRIKNFNIRLVVYVLALTILGIVVIGSANEDYQTRQILGMILGLLVMIGCAILNYSFLIKYAWIFYILAILLLVIVLIFGDSAAGAVRWIDLGFVRFQPSELAKIFLVLFFANYCMKYKEEINKKKRLLITAGIMVVPIILLLMEPDLSTTVVTFLMMSAMLFYTGLTYKLIVPVLVAAAAVISFVIFQVINGADSLLLGYQSDRIQSWLRPEENPQGAYQQQNSIMAIGSGQLFGKGLNNTAIDSVKNGNYISEGQTDFIFAIVGEELGFVGACVMIILMFLTGFECLRTSKKAKDFAGEIICVGMGMLICFQSFVNIGVVTGILPNTGLTLPFVSYGLTSLVTLFLGIGIVLNVSLQARKY